MALFQATLLACFGAWLIASSLWFYRRIHGCFEDPSAGRTMLRESVMGSRFKNALVGLFSRLGRCRLALLQYRLFLALTKNASRNVCPNNTTDSAMDKRFLTPFSSFFVDTFFVIPLLHPFFNSGKTSQQSIQTFLGYSISIFEKIWNVYQFHE